MAVTTLQLTLKSNQTRVFLNDRRFRLVVAGRRWGKTRLAIGELVTDAFRGPDRIGYYIAPNYRQAKRIAWNVLKNQIPPSARRRTSELELSIELYNGSLIQLHGALSGDRLPIYEGCGVHIVLLVAKPQK